MRLADESGPVRVLVLDGDARAALAATRSLAASGHQVHIASSSGRSLAGASRWSLSDVPVGDPGSEPEVWAKKVSVLGQSVKADVWMPITEASLSAAYQTGLSNEESFAAPPPEAYQLCVDKHALLERAAGLGVSVPRGKLIESTEHLDRLPEGFEYPVVLKPRRSRFWRASKWHSAVVRIAYNAEDLAHGQADPGMRCGFLIQEFIPGHGEAVFILADRGKTRIRFAHQRMREKPPTGGQSVLRTSVAPDPQLLAWSERLISDLNWSGPAMVEFRRAPDGSAALMEINPRLWGSVQLAIDSGVDFPSLMVDQHLGREVPDIEARLGVSTRWLLGDLDHLLICLRRSHIRDRLGVTVPRLVRDFLVSFVDGTRTEVFRTNDPLPFLREITYWLRE